MTWFAGQLLLLLLLAFVAGLLVGWLTWVYGWRSRTTTSTETITEVEVDRRVAALVRENEQLRDRLEADGTAIPMAFASAAPADVAPPDGTPAVETVVDVTDDPVADADADDESVALVDGLRAPEEPDDLTRVEGIGPKMHGALVDAGIATFVALARAGDERLRAAIKAAGLRFAPSLLTWSRQAAYLARGDDDGHRAYADRLVAGREVR